jgi:cytochrome c biogenesis protein CcmG, thiol:disulfide interchange protein DsbE
MTSETDRGRGVVARLTLAVAALLLSGSPALAEVPRVGAPAPAIVARTLGGSTFDLASLKGKVVVANIWATWCAPCRAEMPMLDAFYRAHRGDGVVLIGLSADRSRDADKARKVMSAFAYPAALLADAKVDKLDQPRVLPETIVIGKTGLVRAVFGGTGQPLTAADLAGAVDEAG